MDLLAAKLTVSESEAHKAAQELSSEKTAGRKRHGNLVDDLVKALQAKDAAVGAVKRLEALCIESGLSHLATYQELEAEIEGVDSRKKREIDSKQRTIDSLVRGHVSSDGNERRQGDQSIVRSFSPFGGGQREREESHHLSSYNIPTTGRGLSSYNIPTTGSRGLGSLRLGRTLPTASSADYFSADRGGLASTTTAGGVLSTKKKPRSVTVNTGGTQQGGK